MKALNDKRTAELPGIESPPVRPGRKPDGARAMTDAERAKRYREAKKARQDQALHPDPVNLDPSGLPDGRG